MDKWRKGVCVWVGGWVQCSVAVDVLSNNPVPAPSLSTSIANFSKTCPTFPPTDRSRHIGELLICTVHGTSL